MMEEGGVNFCFQHRGVRISFKAHGKQHALNELREMFPHHYLKDFSIIEAGVEIPLTDWVAKTRCIDPFQQPK